MNNTAIVTMQLMAPIIISFVFISVSFIFKLLFCLVKCHDFEANSSPSFTHPKSSQK